MKGFSYLLWALSLILPITLLANNSGAAEKTYPCGDNLVYKAVQSFAVYTGIDGFSPAYIDNENQCLAIDATEYKDVYAAAKSAFGAATGLYNITITTLTELAGESTYRLVINGEKVAEFQNPPTNVDNAPVTHTWKEIPMTIGASIQVEFNTNTNGKVTAGESTAYSHGRWTTIAFTPLCEGTPPCTSDDDVFIEYDGVLVIEAESATDYESKGFTLGTGYSSLGNGFLTYTGPGHLNHSGIATPANTLEYKIKINTPGTYRFVWRNSRDLNAETFDAGNDSWLKILADDYYAQKGPQKIDCNDEDVFLKVWVQKSAFVYECYGEAYHVSPKVNSVNIYATFDEIGEYKILYGGRTPGHMVDRLMLFLDDDAHKSIAFDTSTPESQRGCDDESAGLKKSESISDINIYPNPTTGVFIIKEFNGMSRIEIVDMQGRCLLNHEVLTDNIDISTLENGLYYVRLTHNDGNSSLTRIIKN